MRSSAIFSRELLKVFFFVLHDLHNANFEILRVVLQIRINQNAVFLVVMHKIVDNFQIKLVSFIIHKGDKIPFFFHDDSPFMLSMLLYPNRIGFSTPSAKSKNIFES